MRERIRTRPLGRTGLEVPELGLGAMDTPHSPEALATVEAAARLGATFVDTAREYAGSEFLLGEFVRGHGGSPFVLASKTFGRTVHASQRDVDRSLSILGVDSIDLYQLHDVTTPEALAQVMGPGGALAGLRIARERGLVRYLGVSTHSLEAARMLIDSGAFDTIMLEYSAFYPESGRVIAEAAARGVGVIAMRPLGGSGRTSVIRGLVDRGEAGTLTPANLLRYPWSNQDISVVIPGARYPSRVEENVATALAYEPMPDAERRALEEAAARLYGD